MHVRIEFLIELKNYLKEINETPLNEITWMQGIKPIKIDKKLIEDFELTGLSNIDFIMSGYYKGVKRNTLKEIPE